MSQMPSSTPPAANSTRLVVIALVVALAAVALINIYVEMVRRQAQPGAFTIYRLNRAVRPGDKLNERMVDPIRVPEQFQETFNNAVGEEGLSAYLGEPFQRAASANDPLTSNLFIAPDDDEIDRQISPQKRLIAIPVNSRHMEEVLRPGMYVDIEAPFPSNGPKPNVLPVMELVQIMAVGDRSVVDEESSGASQRGRVGRYSHILIEVTPSEATQFSKITKLATGDYELHLRRPGDSDRPKIPDGGINPIVLRLIE